MRGKFALTVASALLAGTIFAAAQQPGGSGNQGNSDEGSASATPRPNNQGQRGMIGSGGGTTGGPAVGNNREPLQPGGISPGAPPQGQEDSPQAAQPRPR